MKRFVRRLLIGIAITAGAVAVLAAVWYLMLDPYRGTKSRASLEQTRPTGQTLSREQAQEDLRFLAARIEERHVAAIHGLPDAVKQQLAKEIDSLPQSPTVLDVWQAGSRIVKHLGDAHTSVSFYSTAKSTKRLEQQFIVTSTGALVCQTEPYASRRPVSIGDIGIEELYSRFLAMYSYENAPWADHKFPAYIRSAEKLAWLGVQTDGSVPVLFEGDDKPVYLPFVEPPGNDDAAPDFVRYEIDRDRSLGILTLDQCNLNQHYRDVVRQFFTDVKAAGVHSIAVDLRNNGGGNSGVANEFMRYLPVKNYTSFGARMRMGPFLTDSKPEKRENTRVGDLEFDGHVYVLTGRGTFSSAMWFVVILRDNGLCQVIGQPPGNRPSAYGDVLLFQMPNSALAFSVTYKQFSRPDQTKDGESALQPDYPTEITETGDEVMEKLYQVAAAD